MSAILFGLLLLWAQLLAAPPASAASTAHACCHCSGKMSCCGAPSSGSPPAPAVPSNAGPQKQSSIPAPASVAGTLPEEPADLVSSASEPFPPLDGDPLYARDCARLI